VLVPDKDEIWRVEFSRQLQVPTLALDACVTSGIGKSVVAIDAVASKSLPSSWAQRLDRMRREAASIIRKYRDLEQSISSTNDRNDREQELRVHLAASLLGTKTKHNDGLTARIVTEAETIEFGVERYARISDNTAQGLFALLVNHHARPAFDTPIFVNTEDRG
jgi:hypothetical protein